MVKYKILQGDVRQTLAQVQDQSVQCVVTSPPYYGLRDYGTARWEGGDDSCDHTVSGWNDNLKPDVNRPERDGVKRQNCIKCGAKRIDNQLGLEETPEAYVANMVSVFREVRRVLKDDGTLWLNLGDSYATHAAKRSGQFGHSIVNGFDDVYRTNFKATGARSIGIKEKDLIGIPWMVAFALRADGWYLRQDIIWHKPNPMPESVKDRCTKSHEYIFLLSKSQHYYYDNESISEPITQSSIERLDQNLDQQKGSDRVPGKKNGNMKAVIRFSGNKYGDNDDPKYQTKSGNVYIDTGKRNKRSVWTVTTKSYHGAHFATFPMDLIEPCILAGSKVGDTILDPFNGSGTTGYVAMRKDRNYIGCELNPEYIQLSRERFAKLGMFVEEYGK